MENRMSFLHFLKVDGKLIAVIDFLPVFGQALIEDVLQAIEQVQVVKELFEYQYSNRIRINKKKFDKRNRIFLMRCGFALYLIVKQM